jgi:hypothetical protein
MEGHTQCARNAPRQERSPHNFPRPSRADNTTWDGSFPLPFRPGVLDHTPFHFIPEMTLLRRTKCGHRVHTYVGSLLTKRGLV